MVSKKTTPKLARDPFLAGPDRSSETEPEKMRSPKTASKKKTTRAASAKGATKKKAARRKVKAKAPRSPRRRMTDPIVITGISGNLGRLIAKNLHSEHSIIGIDRRPFKNKPKDVIHHQIDPRRSKAEDIFRRNSVRALINLGLVHRARPGLGGINYREQNTMGTIKLLDYCQRYGVEKVVLMSTAYVYGAQPTNSNFLTEDAPLVGNPGYAQMNALIEWDMYAQSFFWKHPEIETVILRPVHVIGPNVRNAPSNYMRLKYPPVLMGFDPMVQIMHESDLIQAIMLALEPGRRGVFNITGAGELPLSRVHEEMGSTPIPIPHPLAEMAIQRLWRLGLIAFPPGELPHLRYQCMVDGSRAKQVLGYRPRYSLKETIQSIKR